MDGPVIAARWRTRSSTRRPLLLGPGVRGTTGPDATRTPKVQQSQDSPFLAFIRHTCASGAASQMAAGRPVQVIKIGGRCDAPGPRMPLRPAHAGITGPLVRAVSGSMQISRETPSCPSQRLGPEFDASGWAGVLGGYRSGSQDSGVSGKNALDRRAGSGDTCG